MKKGFLEILGCLWIAYNIIRLQDPEKVIASVRCIYPACVTVVPNDFVLNTHLPPLIFGKKVMHLVGRWLHSKL